MLSLWQAAVLGLVEGITEYLPVSSTGHLIIAAEMMGLHGSEQLRRATNTFEIAIQGGAILAVLGLYFPRYVQMLRGVMGKDAAGLMLLVNIAVAFVPAAVVGVLMKSTIEKYLFNAPAVIIAFVIGGVFMIIVDQLYVVPRRYAGPSGGGAELTELTPGGALRIGLLQCVAMWPGTSRSMMTIAGGVLSGLRPAAAAEFSFLLGMPTLLAATGLAVYKNFKEAKAERLLAEAQHRAPKFGTFVQELGGLNVAVGALVAAASAAAAVYWLVGFLNRRGLTPFGVYRIVAGAVLFGMVVLGAVRVSGH